MTTPDEPCATEIIICITEYVNAVNSPQRVPYIYDIIMMGSILANVIVPPKGRFKKGMNSHTTAIAVEMAIMTADVVRRLTFEPFIFFTSWKQKFTANDNVAVNMFLIFLRRHYPYQVIGFGQSPSQPRRSTPDYSIAVPLWYTFSWKKSMLFDKILFFRQTKTKKRAFLKISN